MAWSTRARTLPLTHTRKFCVKSMNRPDSSNPTLPSPWTLPTFVHGFPHRNPTSRQLARQLRHTCEQTLLSASQDDRVTPSRHRGCVNVWFGMWGRAVEDTGSGAGAVVSRKVALRSQRAPHKPRQKTLFSLQGLGLEVNFWWNVMLFLFFLLLPSFCLLSESDPLLGERGDTVDFGETWLPEICMNGKYIWMQCQDENIKHNSKIVRGCWFYSKKWAPLCSGAGCLVMFNLGSDRCQSWAETRALQLKARPCHHVWRTASLTLDSRSVDENKYINPQAWVLQDKPSIAKEMLMFWAF